MEDKIMELTTALEQLKELQLKMYAFGMAQSAIYLDGDTVGQFLA